MQVYKEQLYCVFGNNNILNITGEVWHYYIIIQALLDNDGRHYILDVVWGAFGLHLRIYVLYALLGRTKSL